MGITRAKSKQENWSRDLFGASSKTGLEASDFRVGWKIRKRWLIDWCVRFPVSVKIFPLVRFAFNLRASKCPCVLLLCRSAHSITSESLSIVLQSSKQSSCTFALYVAIFSSWTGCTVIESSEEKALNWLQGKYSYQTFVLIMSCPFVIVCFPEALLNRKLILYFLLPRLILK